MIGARHKRASRPPLPRWASGSILLARLMADDRDSVQTNAARRSEDLGAGRQDLTDR